MGPEDQEEGRFFSREAPEENFEDNSSVTEVEKNSGSDDDDSPALKYEGESPVLNERRDMPRETQHYEAEWETELFEGIFGYDGERIQPDVPGEFNLQVEDGEVNISYRVQRRSDITGTDPNETDGYGLFELLVSEGEVVESSIDAEDFKLDLEIGNNPYLELEMSYEEGSNRGRKQALSKMEELQEILEPR
ncbi:MAG: hypothetical protein R6V35_03560 [Candidatus Nanohaloarchaea archaeon]